ncbi:class I SAM-dependent methyltransferase [Tautonia plasticadhaerens]|nr:class I SAM-dependent methyltransferase [Tautonia plasticadhaerens]
MAEADRIRWDARHREQAGREHGPSPFAVSLDGLLPHRGRALDVAGGTGRHALWLARRGLDVTLADLSGVALEIAAGRADREGLPLRTVTIDLEAGPAPEGPWDLIVCVDFLWRPLLAGLPTALHPGGLLLVAHPTRSNLRRHERPGPRHLLDDGELPGLIRGLEVLHDEEGWTPEGRHEARLVARRPAPEAGR